MILKLLRSYNKIRATN